MTFPCLCLLEGADLETKDAIILDFDRAEVTSDTTKLAEEADRMAEMLERCMSGNDPRQYLSKEARKLR